GIFVSTPALRAGGFRRSGCVSAVHNSGDDAVKKQFVILDRDGTVIVERNYLSDPEGVELLPGAAAGLRKMQALGLRLVLITNQSGVGRGLFKMEAVEAVHERMISFLADQGIRLDSIFVCPHRPDEGCRCRKPEPALAHLAADRLGFNSADSVVIGDKACDIRLGENIGASTILVRTGYGDEELAGGR